MRYKVEGHCTRCGACCRKLVSIWYMTGYDPRVKANLGRSGCRFLRSLEDGSCVCRIREGEIPFERLSPNVQWYYRYNCLSYPDPENDAHTPPIHQLLTGCGFRMVEVVDDESE